MANIKPLHLGARGNGRRGEQGGWGKGKKRRGWGGGGWEAAMALPLRTTQRQKLLNKLEFSRKISLAAQVVPSPPSPPPSFLLLLL